MRTVSNAFATLVAANHTLLMKATLTLADGTVLNLTSDDFMAGTARFEQAVSSDGSFDIGGAIVGTMSVTLANHSGKFDSYDLGGATIAPYVGKKLPNNSYEWLGLGTYDVIKPDYYGGTIGITCSDMLNRLAKYKYSDLTVTYPTYPQNLLTAIATHCGLTITYGANPVNNTVSITRAPDMDMTLLDAAGYLAQMMGYWLKCNSLGYVVADWYDTTAFDPGKTPYEITDSFKSLFMTEDVTITGVQVTETDEVTLDSDNEEVNGRAGGTYLYGTDVYCLTIPSNPFIAYGTGLTIATNLYSRVGGMCFRPYNNSMPCDPVIEAGDAVVVTDRHGDTHNAFVTGVVLKPDGAMETRSSAKAPASNSSAYVTPLSMAVTALKAVSERTSYLASSAKTIATATDQHFWSDTNGIHVSTDNKDAAGTNNILINSYGVLLRAAANYLAALTQSGIAFYDGLGNTSDNILATFGSNGAQIGKVSEPHIVLDADSFNTYDDENRLVSHIDSDGWWRYKPVDEYPDGDTTKPVNPGYDPNNPSTLESFIGSWSMDLSAVNDSITFGDTSPRYYFNSRAGVSGEWAPVVSRTVDFTVKAPTGSELALIAQDSDSAGSIEIVSDENIYVNGTMRHNGPIYLSNAKYVYGETTNNAARQLIGLNASDQFVIGYGGYASSDVDTYVEGNNVELRSQGEIRLKKGTGTAVDYAPTAWVYLVGSASDTAKRIRYCKRGGAVFVEVWYESTANVGTTATTLATLPSGFRPSMQVETCAFGNVDHLAMLRVNPGGSIVAKSMSGTMNYFKGAISFPV